MGFESLAHSIPFNWTVLKHGVVSEADLHNKSSRRLGEAVSWPRPFRVDI